ncbi:HD domain-containing phosphohydrolase [Magnetofaba australis]|uniref:Putative response regulator receiver modulated metal dependent phosphohydrolase n=1 Tax=Magnetofaba australis IT-1 TaxID=1434232 RepID=A0A1Y2K433_9PROT|nr:HD domain-containing phosphohydrolase [Magnetofaba australis]OSM04036.1 putative response regulator receiver modulated metal dependent phosphohydrolase [Magnetofaba australis IT-1]
MSLHEGSKIFVVDDTETNIDVLLETLADEYDVSVALDGESALEDIPLTNPDLILLDVMMPGMDGYEVCRRLKENPATREIPVIFITAKQESSDETHGFEVGAVDYITKPFSPPVVRARVSTHLQLVTARRVLANQNAVLEQKVAERTEEIRIKNEELESTRQQIIQRLGRAAEFKDNETGLHVIRMSHYSKILALAFGLPEERAELLLQAAPMHDIGKIGIADRILLKPGKLDDEEWRVMRQHPDIGAGIIGEQDAPLLEMARMVALCHHEKWDGSGYPRGLKGEEIPIEARIVAIADVFDALTTERPYKKAWSVEETIKLLQSESGTHFDPNLTPLFVERMEEVLAVREKWAEEQEETQLDELR